MVDFLTHRNYDEKILSLNDVCDMWPFLMEHIEDEKIEDLDCSDRYLIKDTIEGWLDNKDNMSKNQGETTEKQD